MKNSDNTSPSPAEHTQALIFIGSGLWDAWNRIRARAAEIRRRARELEGEKLADDSPADPDG